MSNDPVLIAYGAKRNPRTNKLYYTEIGRAYPHSQGSGLTLILDYVPVPASQPIVLLERDDANDERIQEGARRRAHAAQS